MLDVKVPKPGITPCRFWHKWTSVDELGMTQYLECLKCKTRRIKQHSRGYQPVNWDWVEGNTNLVNNPKKLK